MDRWTLHARAIIAAGSIVTAMLMGGVLGYVDDTASIEIALQVGTLVGVAVAVLVFAGVFGVEAIDDEPS